MKTALIFSFIPEVYRCANIFHCSNQIGKTVSQGGHDNVIGLDVFFFKKTGNNCDFLHSRETLTPVVIRKRVLHFIAKFLGAIRETNAVDKNLYTQLGHL